MHHMVLLHEEHHLDEAPEREQYIDTEQYQY
jgi:hypothetical protein